MDIPSLTLTVCHRRYLIIDCEQIYKAGSDSGMVSELARQTGYWPQFSFLASMNSLIDLASVGLIGQKGVHDCKICTNNYSFKCQFTAGFSSPLDAQLKQVLEVVATALGQVSTHHIKERQLEARRAQLLELHSDEERLKMVRIQNGTYHDGRIDCVAGSGIMCELGIGDEELSDWEDLTSTHVDFALPNLGGAAGTLPVKLPMTSENEEEIEALPIVIIKNYGVKSDKREVLDVLADWAAGLAENRVRLEFLRYLLLKLTLLTLLV